LDEVIELGWGKAFIGAVEVGFELKSANRYVGV
jgi:hypothetical protein